jgi:hypothetical protein
MDMSWRKNFGMSGVVTTDLRSVVNDVVGDLRRAGIKAEVAVSDAAEALGLPTRTVRALHWGEMLAGRGIDLAAVHARYVDHLRREAERHRLLAERLEQRRAALEREDAACPALQPAIKAARLSEIRRVPLPLR